MSESPKEQGVVGSADIARLAGVRRPAVSNWRRRFDDFPAPVAGSADRPLFALREVQEWCRAHGKDFEDDESELLWQRVRAEVPDLRRTAFLGCVGRVLTGRTAVEDVAAEWRELAEQVPSAQDPQQVYETLVLHWGAGRSRSEISAEVASWMADLAMVEPGERVLDPACAGGGLLVAASRLGAEITLGQDRDADAVAIADARLSGRSRLHVTAAGDSLLSPAPALSAEPADVVLCDPPYRERDWGHEELAEDPRWVHGLPPRGESELAWVQHCLSLVRPGGRVVVLVPASVSYRPGGRRVRAGLVRSGALTAVLEVPGEGSESGLHVWVLTRPGQETPPRHRVLLADAADRDTSLRLYRAFLAGTLPEEVSGALAVEAADLVDDEVDLRPARHRAEVSGGRAEAHYVPLLEEMDAALAQARTLVRELGLEGCQTPMTTLGALSDEGAVELHRAPVAMDTGEGDLPVLTVSDLRKGRPAGERCRWLPGLVTTVEGDVVVAETVREAPVRVVHEEGIALGPRLVLLRAVPGRLDPRFLARAVRPETVAAGRTASGRADLRGLRVPALSLEDQHEYVRRWEELQQQRELSERIAELGARLTELGHRGLQEGALRAEP
ncbi:N-6 DNA methylase [Nocardiopsis kunsanensis]|uniref:N-6 DNA methylase n=1 Tax=Nocardiopsis kunsanensis TaxID=141693 RepID=UPI000476528D|nr:N-6 DNA methylase [Nocardiopsis kunsanensis]